MKFSALLFSCLLFLFSCFLFISPAFAESATPAATNTNPDVPNNLHNWTQNVMIEVMSSLTCQLAGVDPINPKQGCLGIDSASGKIGFLPTPTSGQANGGAIGFMGNMIATLYTPPLHTGDYFQNLAQNFGINKKAYAQSAGTGFQGLTPLIGVWSAFRNIVYLILVIVFIVIGLAIMLRIKIDPRTVMSIQNQIPKIIIGILVVTFSFAIAGFLIDMMWVFIYLIYGIISGVGNVNQLNPASLQGTNAFSAVDGLGGFVGIAGKSAYATGNIISNMFTGPIGGVLGTFVSSIISFMVLHFTPLGHIADGLTKALGGIPLFGKAAEAIAEGTFSLAIGGVATAFFGSTILSWFGTAVAFIIISIALLTALFRLWFTLIMAYVHILIDVVLAPFWIIGGIVPGSPISLSGWLRDLIANLAAFPAVIGMFMLGKVFMDAFGECSPNLSAADLAACKAALANHFVPPLIGNPGEPSVIGSLIGLGIILMTPNVVNMLKTALKAPKIDTSGIGRAIGAGAGLPISTGKTIGSTIFGGREAVLNPDTQKWEKRGTARAFFGRVFGR